MGFGSPPSGSKPNRMASSGTSGIRKIQFAPSQPPVFKNSATMESIG